MWYFLVRDAVNTILSIHKTCESALKTFENLIRNETIEECVDVSKITTDEHGKVTQTIVLQSYSPDSGRIIHSYHVEPLVRNI